MALQLFILPDMAVLGLECNGYSTVHMTGLKGYNNLSAPYAGVLMSGDLIIVLDSNRAFQTRICEDIYLWYTLVL